MPIVYRHVAGNTHPVALTCFRRNATLRRKATLTCLRRKATLDAGAALALLFAFTGKALAFTGKSLPLPNTVRPPLALPRCPSSSSRSKLSRAPASCLHPASSRPAALTSVVTEAAKHYMRVHIRAQITYTGTYKGTYRGLSAKEGGNKLTNKVALVLSLSPLSKGANQVQCACAPMRWLQQVAYPHTQHSPQQVAYPHT